MEMIAIVNNVNFYALLISNIKYNIFKFLIFISQIIF
jgi:hypothetical protein